jgi:hypothetical protein
MVVAHEVQLPQLVKKYQMKKNKKGIFLLPTTIARYMQLIDN